jgi:hypothetical protein
MYAHLKPQHLPILKVHVLEPDKVSTRHKRCLDQRAVDISEGWRHAFIVVTISALAHEQRHRWPLICNLRSSMLGHQRDQQCVR